MSRFDWIVGVTAMAIAGYESISLIGGVAEYLSSRRETRIDGFRLDDQAQPSDLDFEADELLHRLGILRVSGWEFAISRSAASSLSNVDDLRWRARIEPSFKDGRCDGFRLVRIASDSIYAALGFRNGDVIHYVNGFALYSPESGVALYRHLREAAYMDVEFERRKVALRHRYWLY